MRNAPLWLILLLAAACGPPPADAPGFRVVVLGVDGMDPDLVREWASDLPNLTRLASEGSLTELRSTSPPESAVAWASFATGLDPGAHGLVQSIRPARSAYRLQPAYGRLEEPARLLGFSLGGFTHIRPVSQPSYWALLDEAGIATVTLRAPLDLPPAALTHGRSVSGLGTPDVRGSWGGYSYLASDLSTWDLLAVEWAGERIELEVREGRASAEIPGPPEPGSAAGRATVTAEFELNSDRSAVDVRVQGQRETVAESSWSGWFRFDFGAAHGISRFFVLETFPELRLYLKPLSADPRDPAFPISHPGGYAAELAGRHGPFETVGRAAEGWALDAERISEEIFLADLLDRLQLWETILLEELDRGDAAVYSAFFEAVELASQLFYRDLDPEHPLHDPARRGAADTLQRVYRRVDRLAGEVSRRLGPDDLLLLVSNHGIHGWRRDFNTNAWLHQQGYLRLREGEPERAEAASGLDRLFFGGDFYESVDWSKTEAYGAGLAGIYVNLKGRQPDGIVEPGDDYRELVSRIRADAAAYLDPDTGQPVVQEVRQGPAGAADLLLGLREGYRVSWESALGEVPDNVLVANLRKWSGDHASAAAELVPGLLLVNRRLQTENPSLTGLAPTLCRLFGVDPPPDGAGTPLEW